MKRILGSMILTLILSAGTSQAAEIGDIYYHDKSINSSIDDAKLPIGVVYWVSPDKNFGLILSLNQPEKMNNAAANNYCANYMTLGTKAGDWQLPQLYELVRMGKEQWDGIDNNKFEVLNTALAKLSMATPLKSDSGYIASGTKAWNANLSTGALGMGNSTTNTYYVRCVTGF